MENENGRGLTGLDGPQEEGEGLSPQATGYQTAVEQSPRSRAFPLAQMLVDAGILPADEVAKAQEAAWRERQPLGRILVRDGLVLSRDLATLTALNLGLAMVDLRSQTIEREAVRQIPRMWHADTWFCRLANKVTTLLWL